MSTRRVILGNLGGGQYGLRVSLPGHDVVSEAGNPDALSFDSGWTDIVKVIQVGVASAPGEIFFPSQGYHPFAEVRWRSGLRIYDDYNPTAANFLHGLGYIIETDRLRPLLSNTGSVAYAIYNVPVPAPS